MIEEALATKRVVTCVGSGGVGKTTTSAALGLRAAMEGRRTLILTIDPARRLANSLGLSALGNVETRIDGAQFERAGLTPKGELWAMTLDQRRAWDDLVTRYAPNAERRDRILQNRFYRQLSTKLAGSLEYMAMEKVYELEKSGAYDLVVLDTPPTAHALDFIDAPNRLVDLFSHDVARRLLEPAMGASRIGLSIVNIGSSYVLKTLSRFTGADMLHQLAEFFAAFQGMYEGFKERAAATKALLAGPKTGFVLVTGPQQHTVDEAIFFARELQRAGIGVTAAVVNRVHEDPFAEGGAHAPNEIALALAKARVPNEGDPHLADRLATTLHELQVLARRDVREIGRLRETTGVRSTWVVPRLARDVHDLEGLWRINQALRELK